MVVGPAPDRSSVTVWSPAAERSSSTAGAWCISASTSTVRPQVTPRAMRDPVACRSSYPRMPWSSLPTGPRASLAMWSHPRGVGRRASQRDLLVAGCRQQPPAMGTHRYARAADRRHGDKPPWPWSPLTWRCRRGAVIARISAHGHRPAGSDLRVSGDRRHRRRRADRAAGARRRAAALSQKEPRPAAVPARSSALTIPPSPASRTRAESKALRRHVVVRVPVRDRVLAA